MSKLLWIGLAVLAVGCRVRSEDNPRNDQPGTTESPRVYEQPARPRVSSPTSPPPPPSPAPPATATVRSAMDNLGGPPTGDTSGAPTTEPTREPAPPQPADTRDAGTTYDPIGDANLP
jgi:hypothetical protein